MGKRLPSLKGLRAFEAAARHLSFKKAGLELNVTPAAISHLVKTLEEELNEALFIRQNRSLKLTQAGRDIYPEIEEGFGLFERAVQRLHKEQSRRSLKVATAPAFAAKWLVPYLDRFLARYPEFDVNIHAAHEVVDYDRERIDIGIRFGFGNYPGLISERLLSDALVPVCSPCFLQERHLETPDDLSECPLLHDDSMRFNGNFPDWSNWLAAMGVSKISSQDGPRFNTASDAIEAAIWGGGVLLTRQSLVRGDIVAGKLVQLFEELEFPIRQGFHVVYSEMHFKREEVRVFRDWLVEDLISFQPR